jgi:hypothetical protein
MSSPRHRRSVDGESETESLTPSTLEYPVLFGRRYHNIPNAPYLYPNDEHEQQRQDCEFGILQQYVFEKNLFFAPLDHPQKILDIGTGTGIWAVEMAHKFPNSRIKGWDLSAIQPISAPTNVDWEIYDCSGDDWFQHPASMDYIHVSMLWGALPRYDRMISKAMDHLVPGKGWLECQELLPTVFSDDNSIPQDWIFGEWINRFHHASSQRVQPRRSVMIADKIKDLMERAGYVDVHEFTKIIPIGGWAARSKGRILGRLWRQNLEEALEGWSLKPLGPDGLQMSRDEIQVLLAGARGALRDPAIHANQKMYVVYGRRPSSAEAKALKERGQKGAQMRNRYVSSPLLLSTYNDRLPRARCMPLSLRLTPLV